jgi:hypothetical protein
MGNNAALFGSNWNNGANSGSRASNWNNTPANSNNNIGGRGVCDDKKLGNKSSLMLRHNESAINQWSAILSCFGEYTYGSGRTSSNHLLMNGGASFF